MPQYTNKEIMAHLLRSIIGVIGRRTSDAKIREKFYYNNRGTWC